MVLDPLGMRRLRGSRRRLERLKLTHRDKLAGLFIAAFCLLAACVSAWLVVKFRD